MNLPQRRKRRRILLLVGTVPFGILLAGVAMVFLGIPGPLLDAGLARLDLKGSSVEAARLFYELGEGWVLEDVEVFASSNLVTPWAQIDRLVLDPDRPLWADGVARTGRIQIVGGQIGTDLGFWADDLVTRQPLEVRGIRGNLILTEETLSLNNIQGTLSGIDLRLNGSVPDELIRPKEEKKPPGDTRLQNAARQLAMAIGFLEEFSFQGQPQVSVRLKPDPAASPSFSATLEMRYIRGGELRGFRFQEIIALASYRDGVLDLERLQVQEKDGQTLAVAGQIDFVDEILTLKLENTLSRYGLEALSPFSIGKLLSSLKLRIQEKADFTLTLGPSSFDRIGSRFEGHFDLADAFYKDTFFPALSVDVTWADQILTLKNIQGEVGQGQLSGPVEGSFLYGMDSRRLVLDVKGAFKPAAAISLVGGTAESLIREWEFPDHPPEFTLSLSKADAGDQMDMRLNLSAPAALCRGALMENLQAEVIMDEEGVRVPRLTAARGNATLKGNVYLPRDLAWMDLNILTSFPPPDFAPFVGEGLSTLLRPFRFEGSNWIQVEGRVDLTGERRHKIGGKITTTDMVYQWLKFNRFTASFALDGETLSIPDLRGGLVEGTMEASFTSQNTFSSDGTFTLDLDVDDLDLFEVITAATDKEKTPYTGDLTLRLDMEGRLRDTTEKPRAASFTGGGRAEIVEGELFRIPLLLGLSRILDKVIAGFGYAAQSDFSADFKMEEGRVESDNLFLRGNIVSIAGAGFYRFDGKIGANLKVQLLNDGLISDALKILLWPIRKLIEVQLTGTLDNPDWQPRNLPKELFGK